MTSNAGKCANCETFSEYLNERDYCLECADAFEAGYKQARFELGKDNN